MAVKFSNLTQIDKDVTSIKENIGNVTDINLIGDGTISGAIKEINATSTKGIRITQASYDKLSEEEKKGVYFIVDAKDMATDFVEKFSEYTSAVKNITDKLGDTDLSGIGDGTISSALSKLDSVIENADSIVYSDNKDESMSDIGLQTDADLLGGELPSYYASKYDIADINTQLTNISNTVKNINRGKTFNTEAEMKSWLKNADNKHQLVVGDSLYIKEKDKPDYWVATVYDVPDAITNMYYEIVEMETSKVDLSDYDKKIGTIDIGGIGNGTITGAISFLEDERAKLFQSVSDGKRAVANAITGKGVYTAEDAQFATMVNNIKQIDTEPALQEKTVTVGSDGTVITPDSGYYGMYKVTANVDSQEKTVSVTADSYTVVPDTGKVLSKVIINGPTNQGAWTGSTSGNGSITIPKGYHNGNGYVSGANSYNSGYNSGYNAGYSAGSNANYDDESLIVQGRQVYTKSMTGSASATGVTGEYTIPTTGYYYFKSSASFSNSNSCTNTGTRSIKTKIQKYNSSTGSWEDFLVKGRDSWDKVKIYAGTQVRFYFYGFNCTAGCTDGHSGSRKVEIYNCAAPIF